MPNVTFIFQAYSDGSAKLSFDPESVCPRRGFAVLAEDTPVTMRLLPPSDTDEVIESVEMEFRDGSCAGWPFADQDGPDYVWYAGDGPVDTSETPGRWRFGAVLKSSNGKSYIVPDPELQVGDGEGDGT